MKQLLILTALILTFGEVAAADDTSILFPKKAFLGDYFEQSVSVSGTMTGEGIAYRNNQYGITCIREKMECWISSMEQIGPNQIGRMDSPYSYPVLRWTASEVVAGDTEPFINCAKVTITISKRAQTAYWVQEPVNQSQSFCFQAETRTLKWMIDDSIGWKQLNKR